MSLLAKFLAITQHWRGVFPQERTFQRAVRQAPGLSGVSRPALPDPHYLDQRWPRPQLERGVLSTLALPVGAAAVVSAHFAARLTALPATSGRCGYRRHAFA
jgi:hypothetical protein